MKVKRGNMVCLKRKFENMSNLLFFIPTINESQFNEKNIIELVQKEFPLLEITEIEKYITIRNKFGIAGEFYFDKCCLLDQLGESTVELEKIKLINNNANILVSNYKYDWINKKLANLVRKFIHKHFKCYWLDEGIYPEFIGPDHNFK